MLNKQKNAIIDLWTNIENMVTGKRACPSSLVGIKSYVEKASEDASYDEGWQKAEDKSIFAKIKEKIASLKKNWDKDDSYLVVGFLHLIKTMTKCPLGEYLEIFGTTSIEDSGLDVNKVTREALGQRVLDAIK